MIAACRTSLVVGRYVSSLFTLKFLPLGLAVVLIGWNLILLSLFLHYAVVRVKIMWKSA